MPIHFDIQKDLRYLQGREDGIAIGEERGIPKGIAIGEENKALKVARKGILRGLGDEEIADLAELPIEQVRALRKAMEAGE